MQHCNSASGCFWCESKASQRSHSLLAGWFPDVELHVFVERVLNLACQLHMPFVPTTDESHLETTVPIMQCRAGALKQVLFSHVQLSGNT